MPKQMNSEILDALLKAANAAEQAGDFRLADRADELAQRVAQTALQPALQLVKKIGRPAATYIGNDQVGGPVSAPFTNVIEGKGFTFDDALKDTPSSMVGIGSGNYVQSYLTNPIAWLMDAIPATNKLKFMNMLRSQLITSGFTELSDDVAWMKFSKQTGQSGLEQLLRQVAGKDADRFLGSIYQKPDAETKFLAKSWHFIKNGGANWIKSFVIRNFGKTVGKGAYNLSADRAKRATEYTQKALQNADANMSTDELIKQKRLNINDVQTEKAGRFKTKTTYQPGSGAANVAAKSKDVITSTAAQVEKQLASNPAMMQKAIEAAGKTKEGSKLLNVLKSAKNSKLVGSALKGLGRIAVVLTVAELLSKTPDAINGDPRAQTELVLGSSLAVAGWFFPPLAIADAVLKAFGIDVTAFMSDLLVTSAESLGESASGVDMGATREDLINAGMTYNPKTKEWEGGGYQRSLNQQTGLSFEAEMMNMVKSGMSINQAWLITLKKMKDAGSTPEEILTARQKYNQAKTMIYNEGMIGSMKAPVWSAEQITKFEQSLNKHLAAKLQSGVPYSDLLREIDSYMRKVPNLRMINAIRSRIVENLNAAQKSIEKGEKPVALQSKPSTTTQAKVDNSLMSTAHRSRGPRVAIWQQFLAQNGFFPDYNQKTPPVFGPRTTRGTRAFQSKYNLRVDGVVGPETLGKARQLGGKL